MGTAWEQTKPIEHVNRRLRNVDFRVIPGPDIEPAPRKLFAE